MSEVWKAGIPTDADIAILREKFGLPKEEQVIAWEAIEETLKIKRTEHRFRTVTGRWRRQLDREHNIHMRAIAGVGLEVLWPDELTHHQSEKINNQLRGVGRAVRVVERIDRTRLNDESRRVADHLITAGHAVRLAAVTAAKKLPPIDGTKQSETK